MSSKLLNVVLVPVLIGLSVGVTACNSGSMSNNEAGQPPESPVATSSSPMAEQPSPGEMANANFKDTLSGNKLLTALQKGGYVIYFRHAQTEKDYADQADPNMRLDDCETQRKLSEVGIQQSQDIGAAFTAKIIPVGAVITSEYCRSWKTADLAFGKHEKNPKLNFLPFEEYTDAQVEKMKTNVMPLLTQVPPSGKNTIIVGHDDIFEAATGIYPDPQGIAYILLPDGKGGFKLIANMLPEEWAKL